MASLTISGLSTLTIQLWDGEVHDLQPVSEIIERLGGTADEVQDVRTAAPDSEIQVHVLASNLADAQAARVYLEAAANEYCTAVDNRGNIHSVLVLGPVLARVRRGKYAWNRVTWTYRVEATLRMRSQT